MVPDGLERGPSGILSAFRTVYQEELHERRDSMSDENSAPEEWGERLAGLIERREAVVGVIGLGYVGLPLALTFSEAGFSAVGFDVDEAKVEALRSGKSYIGHIAADRIAVATASGRFESTNDFERLAEPDAILICVPTPLGEKREPDLQYVEATANEIAQRLRPGQLVVLESTTYPGTTEEIVGERLSAGGGSVGENCFLAYSPERENPGSAHTTASTPKVVGGVDEISGDLAESLYEKVVSGVVRVSSARVAEASKLTENIFRAVNIALVNELKTIYERLDVDVWEVIDAAATKPFGFMKFTPGPGLGGHCIPIDPFYLSWKAAQHGAEARFIELAGEVNAAMPGYVVGRLEVELQNMGRQLDGARVLVLGLAYKPNVDDPRESPAFEILSLLMARGAEVGYHDPLISQAPVMRSWPELPPLSSLDLTHECLAAQDAVVIVTDHRAVDYELVAAEASLVIDTRRSIPGEHPNVKKA